MPPKLLPCNNDHGSTKGEAGVFIKQPAESEVSSKANPVSVDQELHQLSHMSIPRVLADWTLQQNNNQSFNGSRELSYNGSNSLGAKTKAKQMSNLCRNETTIEKQKRLRKNAYNAAQRQQQESNADCEQRRKSNASCQAKRRAEESRSDRLHRLKENAVRQAKRRLLESSEEKESGQRSNAEREAKRRAMESQEERSHRQRANAEREAKRRSMESDEEQHLRQRASAEREARRRNKENDDQHEKHKKENAFRDKRRRAQESQDQVQQRQRSNAERDSRRCLQESVDERRMRLRANAERMRAHRQQKDRIGWYEAALHYDATKSYDRDELIDIGAMTIICVFCNALKWPGESKGICCSSGKIKLPLLSQPPAPLSQLLDGSHSLSKHFLDNTRRYNTCFQMTSFGTTNELKHQGFRSTFQIQGQVYHKIGSLLPMHGDEAKFLQIYFMGNEEDESNRRQSISYGLNDELLKGIQVAIHEHNNLIKSFKTALELSSMNNQRIVIRADKTPLEEHKRRFNQPLQSEVAVLMVQDKCESRDIILRRQDSELVRISETHRSYDALQYPLIFWSGQDGYNFQLFQTNPSNNSINLQKKISCSNFYCFHLMLRQDGPNILHRFRDLFSQFIVDMYAKIETERLAFIRGNQEKLRAENYSNLKDAIATDCDPGHLGKRVVLPSSFTGSPRYMHERMQDAMTYVRKHGKPSLFITFTCNPKWKKIQNHLLKGEQAHHRHDIVARVFRQKLIKLMVLLTKANVFRDCNCHMYTVEWQKRGLTHAHILLWLKNPLPVHTMDNFICAEIPNREIDEKLYDVVTTQMVHGPCGEFNRNSPCMKEGKCSKHFPRAFLEETQTGQDGYLLYRRRSPGNGGYTATLRRGKSSIIVDNKWIVPYNPLLSKAFKAHINVEVCNSIKSIKYICKYINMGSDMAVFQVQNRWIL